MTWKMSKADARKWGLLPKRKRKKREVMLPETSEQAIKEFLERMKGKRYDPHGAS